MAWSLVRQSHGALALPLFFGLFVVGEVWRRKAKRFSLAAGAAAASAEAKLTMYTTQTTLDNLAANPGSNPPETWLDLTPFLDLGPALQRFNSACLGTN